jgi:hypothetical protein
MKSFKEFEEELNEQQKVDGSDLHYNHEGKLQRYAKQKSKDK